MRFTLNCSKTLARVLKRTSGLSLERLVEPDTARIGTQSIFSEPESLSWQCQYVSTSYQSDSGYVIAVESADGPKKFDCGMQLLMTQLRPLPKMIRLSVPCKLAK